MLCLRLGDHVVSIGIAVDETLSLPRDDAPSAMQYVLGRVRSDIGAASPSP